MITFRDIWGNPDFTSERFFNQTDLAGDELWLHKVNATVRKKQKNRINTAHFLALF